MPILGKRKYINEKIEKLINKLDMLGYDTTEIKKRFYEYEEEPEQQINYDSENDFSYGRLNLGGLPYRDKINDTLKMIEELIIMPENNTQQEQPLNNIYQPNQNNDIMVRNNTTNLSNQFKNNLMNQINKPQQQNTYTPPQQPQSFNLF